MATILLVIIYLAFIGLGLPDSLLGCAWPVARAELNVSTLLAGFVNIATAAGTVASSLMSAKLIRRFGTGPVTAVSIALTSAALFLMSRVGGFAGVLALSIPLGLGAGTVDTALNNYVALRYKANHMNWLHCFWGVGATGSPLIMALFLKNNNWRGAYGAVAAALILIALVVTASFPLWRKLSADTVPAKENARGAAKSVSEATPLTRRELLHLPGAAWACVAFSAYTGVEGACGLWASSYFVTVKGVEPSLAASWTAMYYLGITAGRLVSGFAALRLSDKTLVRIGMAAIAAGIMLMLAPLPGAFQMVALLLAGLGCAPIFPSMLDETPALFGRDNSQGIMGLQFAAAYTGGTVLCPLFGLIAKVDGLEAFPIYLLALMAAMIFALERKWSSAANAVFN